MGFFNEIGKKTTEATSKITKETKLLENVCGYVDCINLDG